LLQGRLAVKVAAYGEQPARSDSAAFELRGGADGGELRLSTPLGSLLAVASWAPGVAELVTPQGRSRFESLAELSRRAVGEDLPLQALPDWLQGRPWPGATHRAAPQGFEQLGWRIDLARHAEGLLLATRAEAPVVEMRVRLDR
jgi:outer membrane lipoprotein LolB